MSRNRVRAPVVPALAGRCPMIAGQRRRNRVDGSQSHAEQRQLTIDKFTERFNRLYPDRAPIAEAPFVFLCKLLDIAEKQGDDETVLALQYLIEDRDANCKRMAFLNDPITVAAGVGSEMLHLIQCDCPDCR